MYAVIVAGGKQYRVRKDSYILVEKQDQDIGSNINFNNVLLASNGEKILIGAPYVPNCTVKTTVEAHGRHKKVKILKFKRRKHHMKHIGHRQWYTKLKINEISLGV